MEHNDDDDWIKCCTTMKVDGIGQKERYGGMVLERI